MTLLGTDKASRWTVQVYGMGFVLFCLFVHPIKKMGINHPYNFFTHYYMIGLWQPKNSYVDQT